MTAAERVRKHLDARAAMSNLDPERIESIGHHVHGQHELLVSDLRELVATAEQADR